MKKILRAAAGRVLMVGIPGPSVDEQSAATLRELAPGGVILFRRNLESGHQIADLIAQLQGLLEAPTLIAVDQEGGRVSRLEPLFGKTPSAEALARSGPDAAFGLGRSMGEALRTLGFNVDFAPVVDLCAAEVQNGIGDRSYGVDPAETARLAGAFLEGLQGAGVAGCLKHFPGLGDTAVDSHVELPVCTRSVDRIADEDLLPFRRLGPEAAMIMVGHGRYPELDPGSELPATLSAPIIDGLLRRELAYRGLVTSDDMEMGAVAPLDVDGRAAVAAVAAGCDLTLYCADPVRARSARDALIRAAEEDPGFSRRLQQAADTVIRTAARWPAPKPDGHGWLQARGKIQRVTAETES